MLDSVGLNYTIVISTGNLHCFYVSHFDFQNFRHFILLYLPQRVDRIVKDDNIFKSSFKNVLKII